ncbi:molybdenum cofactor biosynthesis F family protein, partial [Myxococcota bacterium]|nr:molybdenum cofactor biosynthesis F family protein [Myxococcota bacterium]
DGTTVRWEQDDQVEIETYDAVEGAPSLFIAGVCHRRDTRLSSTLVLDLAQAQATRVAGRLPSVAEADQSLLARVHAGKGLSPVHAEFEQWEILSPQGANSKAGPVHERTDELIGKRVLYTYGDGGIYEHIYLNDRMFTWHCRKGPEAGLADTETCDFFRIRPDVYLFSWREKVIPTLGIVLVNTGPMHSNGFLMGIDTESGAVSHFPVGARGQLLNITEIPH